MRGLIHRLTRRNGRLTLFGRWYLGYKVGPLPALVDDRSHSCNTPYGPTCWCEQPAKSDIRRRYQPLPQPTDTPSE